MQIIIGIFLVSTVVFFWTLINLIAIAQKHGYRVNQWEIFVAILLFQLRKKMSKYIAIDRRINVFISKIYLAVIVLAGVFFGLMTYSIVTR